MIDAHLIDAWVGAMWRATWQGGLAAAVVWFACRQWPAIPARFQVWLWRLVMVKFAVALLWATPIELPLLPADAPVAIPPIQPMAESSLDAAPLVLAETATAKEAGFNSVWLIPPSIWTVAVAFQLWQVMRALRQSQSLRKHCREVSDPALLRLVLQRSRAVGLRKPPTLLETEGAGSPFVLGIFRPAIVLPATTLGRLTEVERSMVLGHELAHVRRADLAWNFIAAMIRALFFFHPLAWLAERRLRLTQEIAADEAAIAAEKFEAPCYAALLVAVVGKLGSNHPLPVLAVGAVGSQTTLQRRLHAMRFIQPVRFRVAVTYAVGLSIVAAAAVVPWKLTAADAPPAADNDANGSPAGASKPAASQPVVRMDKTGRGKFISFQDGTLVVNSRSGETLAWSGIFDDAKGLRYDAEAKAFQPMTAVEALSHAQPGAWIQVIIDGNNKTVRVGERKQQTIGTFMSFKDERLLIMLKDTTPTSYTKKYGFQVHFNKFFPNVPVYESIDGGPYQLIGIAENSLGDVKEGTIVTVHAAGDDNITMVQIGVPKMP